MGCAGGVDANIGFPMPRIGVGAGQAAFWLNVQGLRGGHSGVNIHQDRGNANKLLARLLLSLQQRLPLGLAQLEGGTLRNAIPREARALLLVPQAAISQLEQAVTRITSYNVCYTKLLRPQRQALLQAQQQPGQQLVGVSSVLVDVDP